MLYTLAPPFNIDIFHVGGILKGEPTYNENLSLCRIMMMMERRSVSECELVGKIISHFNDYKSAP